MQYQHQNKKKSTLTIIGIVLLVVVLIAIPISLFTSIFMQDSSPSDYNDYADYIYGYDDSYIDNDVYFYAGGVSSDEFKKLQTKMSYAQVSGIIGGDGELIDSGETLQGETYYTYGWIGEDNESAEVYITITSDMVTDITLEGQL